MAKAKFLSTPSGWRATETWKLIILNGTISIHALRVEGDGVSASGLLPFSQNFYPRPPGGGRPRAAAGLVGCALISIHALRVEGDSSALSIRAEDLRISIHALRVEGDPEKCDKKRRKPISIHALRVEGDASLFMGRRWWVISIHALRVEGDFISPSALADN